MKALLTGASSFSGLWFARALAERGVEVIAPLRGGLNTYSGLRQARVRELAKFAEIVSGVEFGSAEFFELLDRTECDILCHHAARVADYRSPAFDVNLALAENTRGIRALSERLSARACSAVILTGSVFESDEGAGTEPRRAFSPYGLSKALTASVIRYWCEMAGMPLGKFVIAEPIRSIGGTAILRVSRQDMGFGRNSGGAHSSLRTRQHSHLAACEGVRRFRR